MSYSPNFRGESSTSVGDAVITGDQIVNNTGSILYQLTPVRINNLGNIVGVDVTNETASAISGVIAEDISSGASGLKALTGIIKNISVAFVFGDVIYVSRAGSLTNVKPSLGIDGWIEGDYVIRIGVIGRNEDNFSNLDLHLGINVVGQL